MNYLPATRLQSSQTPDGVAYHFFNDHNIWEEIYTEIRSSYDGPLTLANCREEQVADLDAATTANPRGLFGV